MIPWIALLLILFSGADGSTTKGPVFSAVDQHLPKLVELYKWFHANPELSLKEFETAKRFASEVRSAGWEVHEGIGGTGVVAILKNGSGPLVFTRIDMDGLPVTEETGLPYASTNGVMHACGHDVHLATGVGLAWTLANLKDQWQGTVVLIGQPAEEVGKGAKAMLADPKFHELIPEKPIACLSVHDMNSLPAGKVGICSGWAKASVDSVDITVYGKGGHGAWPHNTIDPIVISSEIIMALQTIVARKIDPQRRAVITVGSIHGGKKHNIIPNKVEMQLTVRSYEDEVREKLLAEIKNIAEGIAKTHHAPKLPDVVVKDESIPAVYHDPEFAQQMWKVFEDLIGEDNVKPTAPMMGGEDFGLYSRHWNVPALQFALGAVNPELFDSGKPIPGLHSSTWAPDPEPTLRTGVAIFARAVISLLPREPRK